MIVQFRLRRATSAEWATIDPVLEDGEPGWEHDTNRIKLGDGETRWSALGYATYPATEYDQMIGDLTQDLSELDASVAAAETAAGTATTQANAASASAVDASTSAADAEAAEARVTAIGATNDTQTASFINNPASATSAALQTKDGTYLVAPTGTATENVASLLAAVTKAAADKRALAVRGTFDIDNFVDLPANTHLDLSGAVIRQVTDIKCAFRTQNGPVTIRGGTLLGKTTDYVNSSTVYGATAVRIQAGSKDVSVLGVTMLGWAGAGVEINTGTTGQVIVRDCVATGAGFTYMPTNAFGISAGVRLLVATARVTIENNDFSAFGQGFICSEGSVNLRVAGNHFHDNSQHGAYTQTADSMVFVNNVMRGNRICGMKQTVEKPNPGLDGYDGLIADNVAKNNGAQGILLTNPSIADDTVPNAKAARLRRFRVQGNICDGNQRGIEINPGCIDLVVTDNTVRNTPVSEVPAWAPNTAYALYDIRANGGRLYKVQTAGTSAASGGPTGTSTVVDGTVTWVIFSTVCISVSGAVGVEITSNRTYGATGQGVEALDCAGVKIHDNVVQDCGQNNNATSGGTEYGIDVSGATTEAEVTKNKVTDTLGNMKYGINIRPADQSTFTVYDNSGSGATDYGISTLGTTMTTWRDNSVAGTLGMVLNTPFGGQLVGAAVTTSGVTVSDKNVRVVGTSGAKLTIATSALGYDIKPVSTSLGNVSAAAVGDTTLTIAGATFVTNEHAGKWVEVTDPVVNAASGDGTVHARRILSNTATVLTLEYPIGYPIPASTPAVVYVPLDEVAIEDLIIDRTTAGSANIVIRYVKSLRLTRVKVTNSGNYTTATGNALSIYHCDKVRLQNVEVVKAGGFGCFIYNCDDVKVDGYRCNGWGNQFALQIKDSRNVVVSKPHCVGDGVKGDTGVNTKCSGLNPSFNVVVVDGYAANCKTNGYEFSSITAEGSGFAASDHRMVRCYSSKATIAGFNTISDAGSLAAGIRGLVWQGCVAVDSPQSGFVVGVPVMLLLDCIAARNGYEGVNIIANDAVVRGGRLTDNVQAYVSGATRSSEVLIGATTTRTLIDGMTFERTTAGKSIRAVRELAGAVNTIIRNTRINHPAATGYTNDFVLSGTGSKAVGDTSVDFYGGTPPTIVKKPNFPTAVANPDTSGATLAALETEVNELKALLRTAGLLA